MSAVRQMELWGVPRRYVEGELFGLLAMAQGVQPSAAALEQIFDEYDYWDSYTERYVVHILPLLCWGLVLIALDGLGGAFYWGLVKRELVIAFLLAGATGAALSVLLKLPPLGVYGELVKTGLELLGRFTTGVVMSAAGLGVIALGLLNVPVPVAAGSKEPLTLTLMAERCLACEYADDCSHQHNAAPPRATSAACGERDAGTDAGALSHTTDRDAGDAPDGGASIASAVDASKAQPTKDRAQDDRAGEPAGEGPQALGERLGERTEPLGTQAVPGPPTCPPGCRLVTPSPSSAAAR